VSSPVKISSKTLATVSSSSEKKSGKKEVKLEKAGAPNKQNNEKSEQKKDVVEDSSQESSSGESEDGIEDSHQKSSSCEESEDGKENGNMKTGKMEVKGISRNDDSHSEEEVKGKVGAHGVLEASASEIQVTKKRRISLSGKAVASAGEAPQSAKRIKYESKGSNANGKSTGKGGKTSTNTPFRRVDPDKVPAHLIKDNRYEAKVCSLCSFSIRVREY
jgi:hypothetical protein